MPANISMIPITTTINTTGSDTLLGIILPVGVLILLMVVMVAIFWNYETKGNRLYWLKNGVMRRIRFTSEQVSPEGFLKVAPEEAIELGDNPIQLRNFFGSTNPTYFAAYPFPITLDLKQPEAEYHYLTPAQVASGIDVLVMRELQTYREKRDGGAVIGYIAIGAILGIMVGMVLPSFIGG